jgi:hypothetical protein
MATSPVEPSKFHQIIRELGKVRTKGGFAALNAGLFFLAFFFSLFLMTGWERLLVSLLILGCWMFFAVYAFIRLRQGETETETN